MLESEEFHTYDKQLNDDGVSSDEKYSICLKMWQLFSIEKKYDEGIYYLVQSHNYDNEKIDGIYELIKHYCCINRTDLSFLFYFLIKDNYEKNYKNIVKTDENIVKFFLPYYMIIICERTKNYDLGIKMYEIIFTEKQKITEKWWIECLLTNLLFFIDKTNNSHFHRLCENYLNHLYVQFNGKDFVCASVLTDLVESYLDNKNLSFYSQKNNKNFIVDKTIKSNKILIYTGFAHHWWNSTYGKENYLGGSERAVSFLSECFPKNMEIYISGEVIEEKIDNVKYIHFNNLEEILKNTEFHAIIISRYIGFLEQFSYFKTKYLLTWAHDVMLLPYNTKNKINEYKIIEKTHEIIDWCICLTNWHKEDLSRKYPLLEDKIRIIQNGIDFSLFPKTLKIKVTNRFVYSSNPGRGLKRLLELWPDICIILPDAELKIIGLYPAEEDLKSLLNKSENVEHLGEKNPEELYNILATCDIWFYPTNFNETYCITAIEMLYSKVVPIYYSFAGLTETIGDYGISVKEGDELRVISELTEDKKDKMRERGRIYAENCSWVNRATMWNSLLEIE